MKPTLLLLLLFLLGMAPFLPAQPDSPTTRLDSLLSLAQAATTDSARFRLHDLAANEYLLSRDFEAADSLISPYQKDLTSWASRDQLADFYYQKAKIGFYLTRPDSATRHFGIADSLLGLLGRKSDQVRAINSLGSLALKRGDYPTATRHWTRGLGISEELGDSLFITVTSSNLGWTNFRAGIYDEAEQYTRKALRFYEGMDNASGMAQMYQNLGAIYASQDSTEAGVKSLRKALAIWKSLGDPARIAWCASNLGGALNYDGQLRSADSIFRVSLQAFEQIHDPRGKASTLLNLGTNLNDLERYAEAAPYLQQAYDLAREVDYFDVYYKAQANLALSQSHTGQFEAAYRNRTEAARLKDSLKGVDVQDRITDIQEKYKAEQKERELAEQALKLYQKDAQLLALGGSSLALLLFGVIFYLRNKARQQARLQQAVIREQERGLEAVFQATEAERKRIAKDLHDGVGQQLSALKMGFQQLKEQVSPPAVEQAEKLSELIDETARDTRSISHQMMPRALTELGLVPAIEDALAKSLGNTPIQYEFEHFNLQKRYAENKEVALYRILQELINNVIKHSGACQVAIQLFQNAGKLILVVEDDGKGIKQVPSDGIGLLNIKNRLNTLQGKVNFEPSADAGTTATVMIPV